MNYSRVKEDAHRLLLIVPAFILASLVPIALGDDEYVPVTDWGPLGPVEFEMAKEMHEVVVVHLGERDVSDFDVVISIETLVIFENQEETECELVFKADQRNYLRHDFELGTIAPAQLREVEFSDVGYFPFYCALYPQLRGAIQVR
jgi:hypothetical protein